MAPLSFGNGSAALHRGLHASTEAMAQVVPTLRMVGAWGFSSLAAFSALYRKHFGESPSQTLAQR